MDISPLSWTGCDSHTWHLLTIMTMAIGIDGSNAEGVLFQGRAITGSLVGVALIDEAVDMSTNALFVVRCHMEDLVAQNVGREKALQEKERSIILEKEMSNAENQIL